MSSNEIGTNVIFKKQLGLNYEIDQKYVGLKMKENNILSFNFRVPGDLINEVELLFINQKIIYPFRWIKILPIQIDCCDLWVMVCPVIQDCLVGVVAGSVYCVVIQIRIIYECAAVLLLDWAKNMEKLTYTACLIIIRIGICTGKCNLCKSWSWWITNGKASLYGRYYRWVGWSDGNCR